MTERTVHTQAELDQAITDKIGTIYIDSPVGLWLTITDLGSSRAELRGSSRAELWESSSAELYGSSSAVLYGSSSAELYGSSSAELWGSSRAVLWGSSRAVLWGSSRAELWGSSSAVLWGSSRAVLRESSRAELYGSSSAVAAPYTAVFLHSATAKCEGGNLIDLTKLNFEDPATWCDYHGVKMSRGHVTLYKAVDDAFNAGHDYKLTNYAVSAKVKAEDWRDDHRCGGGLHLGPTPRHAREYYPNATRFVAVKVRLADLRPIVGGTAKCKVPAGVVLREVDVWGETVAPVEQVAS